MTTETVKSGWDVLREMDGVQPTTEHTPSLIEKIEIMGREIDRLRNILNAIRKEAQAGARGSAGADVPAIINQTFSRIDDLAHSARAVQT